MRLGPPGPLTILINVMWLIQPYISGAYSYFSIGVSITKPLCNVVGIIPSEDVDVSKIHMYNLGLIKHGDEI